MKNLWNSIVDGIKGIKSWSDFATKANLTIEVIRRIVLYIIAGLFVMLSLAIGLGFGYVSALTNQVAVPTKHEMRAQLKDVNNSTSLYFANDKKVENLQKTLTGKSIKLSEMSPYLKKAVVATEDSDFYKHSGVEPKSLLRAVLSDVTGIGTQTGGSTLTQQTVKMQLLSSETTWKRKAVEIFLAMRVDKYFTKDEILEDYLNAATLGRNNKGQNIQGVQAAAKGIFGKNAADLNLAESAFIAGLPQSPSIYTPFDNHGKVKDDISLGLKRKNIVLFRMYRDKKITESEYNEAKNFDLKSDFLKPAKATDHKIKYGYVYNLLTEQTRTILIKRMAKSDGIAYKDLVKDKSLYEKYWTQADTELHDKNYRVDSTINKKLYQDLNEQAQQFQDNLGTTHTDSAIDQNTGKSIKVSEPVQNGSVLLDNKTGQVLAFVGGVNFKKSQLNHAFDTNRSPGSSIKPLITFAPAIENGAIGSQSMLADFKTKFKSYAPTDYGETIQNRFVSARETLEESYNIPSVNLYNYLRQQGISSKQYMSKMGINLTDNEYKQLGITLGGTDKGVTVLQQASAFSTFANKGVHVNPYVVDKITDPTGKVIYGHKHTKKRVFSKQTSYIMQNMMHGVVTKGTASALSYESQFSTKNLFGKTGTSNDYRDNWFIGSTDGVTLASWIGYDNLYGNNYNLASNSTDINQELWSRMANAVYEDNPGVMNVHKKFSRPDGVQSYKVDKETGTNTGSIDYNGISTRVNQHTTSSLYYKGSPKNMSYDGFAIGASAKNYRLFWGNYFGRDNGYGVVKQLGDSSKSADEIASENGSGRTSGFSNSANDSDSSEVTTTTGTTTTSGSRTSNNTTTSNGTSETGTGSGSGSGSGSSFGTSTGSTSGSGGSTGETGGSTGGITGGAGAGAGSAVGGIGGE
ncbi:transglycosylase domain-containing protein [Companilactobacillus sp.]|uniref:transglycosylase domain-containing protein n=1 Tax=Companilactobacillus sp. TaxID=2767905 RepID=UPI0025C27F1E|nr:transglycosylase domain-containing protein [Companilactobacillus sp.]MCH4010317.1 penicillin-binding protein [Companilactobacillus sp.]MCH4052007.1 penicillin-binding protein [Companilactobacillus sp.]MCH4078259.1 penicillin-binding protein [Companilactobacillus sp.]MCH4126835.1 penicillin-binding protein [Companilactobacillus sp.]MCH4132674.1 penicillin-binding protein [Companilactobacillus sp.]